MNLLNINLLAVNTILYIIKASKVMQLFENVFVYEGPFRIICLHPSLCKTAVCAGNVHADYVVLPGASAQLLYSGQLLDP